MKQSIDKEKQAENILPVLIKGSFKNGKMTCESSFSEIGALVSEGYIVILKDVFDSQMMLSFRRQLVSWCRNNPTYPHGKSPSETPEVNYHRIDDGVIRSVCPHVFHQIGLSSPEKLENNLSGQVTKIANAMKDLQNQIAKTDFNLSPNGLRLKILQYPLGGGFLAEHSHPIEPQRLGLILSLSKIGKDFSSGGTFFQTPRGRVDTLKYHDIGDIVLFRYDLPHAVAIVNEDEKLDWSAETGKWSVVLELRETHALSHKI